MILSEEATKKWKPVIDSLETNLTNIDKEILSFFCEEYNKLTIKNSSSGDVYNIPELNPHYILPVLIKIFTKSIELFNENKISYSFCNKSDENPDIMLEDDIITFIKISEFTKHNISLLLKENVYEYLINNPKNYIQSKVESIFIDKCVKYLLEYAITNNNQIVIKIGNNQLEYIDVEQQPKFNLSIWLS